MTSDDLVTLAEIIGLAVALVAMAAVVYLVGRAIMAASQYAPGSQLVVVLALLAVLAIMAALAGGDLGGDFITLAATAIGALAAALTTWAQRKDRRDDVPPETPGAVGKGDAGPRTDQGVAGLRTPDGPDGPGRPVEGSEHAADRRNPSADGEARTADDDDG